MNTLRLSFILIFSAYILLLIPTATLAVTETLQVGQNITLGTYTVQIANIDRSVDAVVVDTFVEGKYDNTLRLEKNIQKLEGKITVLLEEVKRDNPNTATITLQERALAEIIEINTEGVSIVEQENRLKVVIENTGVTTSQFVLKAQFSTSISSDDTTRTITLAPGQRKASYLRFTPLTAGEKNVVVSILSNNIIINSQSHIINSISQSATQIECKLTTTTFPINRITNAQVRCINPFFNQKTIRINVAIGTQTGSLVVSVGPKETKLVTVPIKILESVTYAKITTYDGFGNLVNTKKEIIIVQGTPSQTITQDKNKTQNNTVPVQDNKEEQASQNGENIEVIERAKKVASLQLLLTFAGVLVLIAAILAGILVWIVYKKK